MSVLTLVVAVVVALACTGRVTWGQALAVGGATPAGAAIIAGPIVVPTFYGVALAATGVLVLHRLGLAALRLREGQIPGLQLLTAFFLWSVLVTLTAPLLFDGLTVVHPTTFQLVAGVLTSSNLAQIAYLALGIGVVVLLARSEDTGPGLLSISLGLCLLFSLARHVSLQTGLPFPEGVLDNSPGYNFIETDADGGERVRGILAEPAALATICVTGLAYFLLRSTQVQGVRRLACLALAAVALYLGVVSTSATFVVAGLLTLAVFATTAVVSFAARRSTMTLTVGLLTSAAIVVVGVALPTVSQFVSGTVNDKLGSSSFQSRSGSDALSFEVLLDSYGWGVGLGSARASSFVPTLLSATGVVGAILFVAALATIVLAARGKADSRPVMWALVALLVVKVVSSPDLSDTTGVTWIALGLLSHTAMRARGPRRRGQDASPAEAVTT